MVYAPEAVAMARRLGDRELICYSLLGMLYSVMGSEHADQPLAISAEMLDLAKAANSTLETAHALFWHAYSLLAVGDAREVDAEFEAYGRACEELNQPLFLTLFAILCAMRALMNGRFEDSARLAQQAFAIGQRMQTDTAAGVFGLQMFAVRREQGRLKEIEPLVRVFLQEQSAAAAWRPGLAVIYSELGRTADARAEFEILAQHDFADLPRDAMWMGTMTYLVDVCTFLKDRARAATLYGMLLPFAPRNVIVGNAAACYGSLSRYLGALAATLERWDDAERHFEDAMAMNASMDARPWLARTQDQYAEMLLARNQSGDRDKAVVLLEAALVTARELGMRTLEERITAGLAQLKPDLH
jgi:tetratricopeptide (TPR) repeat protein